MEKESNMIIKGNYNLKENIQTGKEMEKEKNMIIMVTYNSKVNI